MTKHLDPAFLPFVPVIGLTVAADEDDLHNARSELHEDLVADVEANTTGWAEWWADNRPRLTGYGDDDKWAMTISERAWHRQWEQWGRRVSITERGSMSTEPGGVTEHGEPYEQVARDAVAERTFWVVETDEGWKVRGFNVT